MNVTILEPKHKNLNLKKKTFIQQQTKNILTRPWT